MSRHKKFTNTIYYFLLLGGEIMNCPNCGAPTQITSSGKCEYCGSIITTGEHSWALSNLERI